MSTPENFKVTVDRSVIPPGFFCSSLDLMAPEFSVLRQMGCCCIAQVASPPGWEILRKSGEKPHFDLFFITSGSLAITDRQGTLRAREGEVLIVLAGNDRRLFQDESSTHVYIRIDTPELFPQITGHRCRSSENVRTVADSVELLLDRRPQRPDESAYRAALISLLQIALDRELRSSGGADDYEQEIRLQKLLNAAGRRSFEVQDVAREFGMSLTAFRHFCRDHFHKSPHAVIAEARMCLARGMLDYHGFTIDEIAERVGFKDRFVFSKAFVRECGISPAAFRKRYGNSTLK